MNAQWISVFNGPVWEALAVQSLLTEAGLLAHVPDSNTRLIDPYITGGDAFSLSVLVPLDSRESALALVQSRSAATQSADEPQPDTKLADFARRMRWMTVLMWTAPIALVMGIVYLARVRRSGVRPAEHGFNLLTIVVAGVFSLVSAVIVIAAR